jgi:hypothetical protein
LPGSRVIGSSLAEIQPPRSIAHGSTPPTRISGFTRYFVVFVIILVAAEFCVPPRFVQIFAVVLVEGKNISASTAEEKRTLLKLRLKSWARPSRKYRGTERSDFPRGRE